MKNGTLPLGKATVDTLLAMARSMLTDPKEIGRELLYDSARELTFRLVRADRSVAEVEHLARTLRRIAGLASAEVDKHDPIHGRLVTLIDMLTDQGLWKEHYNVGTLKEMPYFHASLKLLKRQGKPMHLFEYFFAMGFDRSEHSGPISILSELRLVTWEEDKDGAITLRLTEAGEAYLRSLAVQPE